MDTKEHVVRSRRRRWVRRRPLTRRRLSIAIGIAILLAWSVPHLIDGWNYLVGQAVTNLIYGPNIELRARKEGENLAKRRRGLTERQLTQAFDRRIKSLKDPVTNLPLSGVQADKARSAFIKGYQGKRETKNR